MPAPPGIMLEICNSRQLFRVVTQPRGIFLKGYGQRHVCTVCEHSTWRGCSQPKLRCENGVNFKEYFNMDYYHIKSALVYESLSNWDNNCINMVDKSFGFL